LRLTNSGNPRYEPRKSPKGAAGGRRRGFVLACSRGITTSRASHVAATRSPTMFRQRIGLGRRPQPTPALSICAVLLLFVQCVYATPSGPAETVTPTPPSDASTPPGPARHLSTVVDPDTGLITDTYVKPLGTTTPGEVRLTQLPFTSLHSPALTLTRRFGSRARARRSSNDPAPTPPSSSSTSTSTSSTRRR